MSLLAHLRARAARRRLLRAVGLDRKPPKHVGATAVPTPSEIRLHLARHLSAAEAATLSVDLDLLAHDLGVEIREDALLVARERCEGMIERLRDGIWWLSLAESLPNDDRRLLTALLLALRAERTQDTEPTRLLATDAWTGAEIAPEVHALALALLVPPGSARTLMRVFPGDRAAQARRLRISPSLLALALRGHVSP